MHDVDGILLPRPFKIVKHGPVNLFVEDVARARDFYLQILGLQVTEEVTYRGEPCVFLRCNTEHHSLGLFPLTLREPLGLSIHTTCASFGIQVANYRQLREAVAFLRAEGVRVETDRVPPELHPSASAGQAPSSSLGSTMRLGPSIRRATASSSTTTWSRWVGMDGRVRLHSAAK